jgi:hypothetical protein
MGREEAGRHVKSDWEAPVGEALAYDEELKRKGYFFPAQAPQRV